MYTPLTCSRVTARRNAFSRSDVLAVVLLLSIFVFLCLPGIFTARLDQALVACTNNLREIGGAYQGFVSANKANASKLQSYNTLWTKQLRAHLKIGSTAFKCPKEVPRTRERMPDAKILVRESTFPAHPYLMYIPLSKDGARMRLSESVHCPSGFALELESAGVYRGTVNFDWKDLVMTVQPQPDGSVKLTAISAIASPYSFDLYDAYGQLLVYDFAPNLPNNTYTFPPDAPGLGSFSYGMNPAARSFSSGDDSNKILVAEYKKVICNVIDARIEYRQLEVSDFWPLDCAPRHNGMLNVLFMNGAVKTQSPRDIDPRRPALAKEYWLPTTVER